MLRISSVIAVLFVFSSVSLAGGGKALFAGEGEGGGGGFARIRQILGTLSLSPDQQSKTNEILNQAAASARALRSQAKTGDKTAIHDQMRTLRMQTISQIEQILNSDQRARFREQLKELRQEMRQQRNKPTTQPNN
jgi:Spy/CpxP family protein refolding chaperone